MTAQDEVELPRQVGGVAQPEHNPCPQRGHLVGGVAGQQDPPSRQRSTRLAANV